MSKSNHQRRIELFMAKAGQGFPEQPTVPDEATRKLRAKLIFEEAMETIEALGFVVTLLDSFDSLTKQRETIGSKTEVDFRSYVEPNLIEIADGCADISVVTYGTLSACGIADMPIIAEVDRSNLDKFGEGGYKRADGKWMKPKDWRPPEIESLLREQGWTG